jgi:ParB/RepB/Spo0J family partition protein
VAHDVTVIPVARIRPEEGLGRKRDRAGHTDLQRSIEQFGVLTPITVREADDGSGDYVLIKGQGRTLACRLLGLVTIPAIIADQHYAQTEKVQQFLVENVARLKMHPVDRALLIRRARENGEETTSIAQRFGVTATTVRRLLAQIENASSAEVAALRAGEISLTLHAVITRHVDADDRADVVQIASGSGLRPREFEAVLIAFGWRNLARLGASRRAQRLSLLAWACHSMRRTSEGLPKERIRELARSLPHEFDATGTGLKVAAR